MRDKEKQNHWQREYYQRHKNDPKYKAKRRGYARRYYQKNKGKFLDNCAKYRLKNIEKYQAYRRDYKAFNPRGIYSALKGGAKRRGIDVCFAIDDFVSWWNGQDKVCHYCKRTIEDIKKNPDSVNLRARRLTIDRANNNKPYSFPNIRLACYRCNNIKGDYFTEKEMLQIGKIINVKDLER